MLYVSTRNSVDTFTAHRALHEGCAPDGGFYVPFHLHTFSADELLQHRAQPFAETVAQILNMFFGLRLTGVEVEFSVGRTPVRTEYLNYNLIMAELWRNPASSFDYVLKSLYTLISGKYESGLPVGWTRVAIEIAVLFGIYGTLDSGKSQQFDIAVTTDDFADIAAALYAKDMGLPVIKIVCACNDSSGAWDLINRGEFATTAKTPYLEYLLFRAFGAGETGRYLDACHRKATYYLNKEQPNLLANDLFAAVVGSNRIDTITSSMFTTNRYHIDALTAVAFGGLQDYRAHSGISANTLIFAKQRPAKAKE